MKEKFSRMLVPTWGSQVHLLEEEDSCDGSLFSIQCGGGARAIMTAEDVEDLVTALLDMRSKCLARRVGAWATAFPEGERLMPRKPRPFSRTIRGRWPGDCVELMPWHSGTCLVESSQAGAALTTAGLRALSKACLEAVAVLEQRKKERR